MSDGYKDHEKNYFNYTNEEDFFSQCEGGSIGDLLSCVADLVALECGNTFIEYTVMSPFAQWQRIIKMLNIEGFTIIKKRAPSS